MRILFTLLFLTLAVPLWAAKFEVVDAKGNPSYRAKGQFKVKKIEKGNDLAPGGRIKMSEGDFVKLKTPMGDEIELSGKTYMKLSELTGDKKKSTCKLELFQGIASNKVHKLQGDSVYEIRTPSAVAGVRGTEFQCTVSESGETEVAVLEGEVAVAPADDSSAAVPVSTGRAAKVKKGGGVAVKVVKNIRARAAARAAKAAGKPAPAAAKSAPASSGAAAASAATSGGEAAATSGSSGGDAGTTESSDAEVAAEAPETEEAPEMEEVDTSEMEAAIEEAAVVANDALEEANEEIQNEIVETAAEEIIEEASDAAVDISVDLESIVR